MSNRRATLFPAALALAEAGRAPEVIMLMPAGAIKANDDRAWRLDDAAAVVAASMAAGVALPIDWEHAQDVRADKGEAAPAAGWIESLEARAEGIFGRVAWTEAGRASVESRAYRYISPAFLHDQAGRVIRLIGAGLVNRPAITMPALARAKEEGDMDHDILAALGLAAGATKADALSAIGRLTGDLKAATARAETPDATKFVPKAQYDQALQRATAAETKIAEAAKAAREAEIVGLVDQAVKDGKVAPASRDFYLATCRKEGGVEEFKAFLATAPKIVAGSRLDDGRTVGADPGDPVELATAAAAYRKKQADAGIVISHAEAVRAVAEGREVVNPLLIKSHAAAAAIAGSRIVKYAAPSAGTTVAEATAPGEPLVGIADAMGAAEGGMLDVHLAGIAEVCLGGTVEAGEPLTADANGKAVACAPAAGETRAYVGFARAPGVANDVIPVLVAPGFLHEPAGA